jgi:ketosteroid isomerase-like protein
VSPPSQRNVQQVKDAFARWNSGVRDVDLETIDPEVELHTPLGSTRGGPYRGHEGFRQWLRDIDEQFEEWRLEVNEWRPLDDGRLLSFGNIHAKGRGSGVELDQELAWLFAFRDEKLIRYDAFYSRDEGLRAAGLER